MGRMWWLWRYRKPYTLLLLLFQAADVAGHGWEDMMMMSTTPWEMEPVTGPGEACPLNYQGNDEWHPAYDICYRFMPLPMNWRHSSKVCHELGTPNCPAELLRLEHAPLVIDLELDKGDESVFPNHRPIRLAARFVSYGETWIEGDGEAAPPFPLNYSMSELEPFHFEGEDGETASLAFPAGWICGGTNFAERHVFVCQSCSNATRDPEPPEFCDDSCGGCNMEILAEECPAYSGYCPTNEGDCLLKHEAPGYEKFFDTGDPCFLHEGSRVCITSLEEGVAKVSDCNCFDDHCGCSATINERECMSPQGTCLQRKDVPEEFQELYADGDTSCFEMDGSRLCIFGFGEDGAALTSECDCFQPACDCPLPKCKTSHGKCLTREQAGPDYEPFYVTGNPCFWSPKFEDAVCIVDFNDEGVAQVSSCDCDDFVCGCRYISGEKEPPTPIPLERDDPCVDLIPEVGYCDEDQGVYCRNPFTKNRKHPHTLCEFCSPNITACGPFCEREIVDERDIAFVVDLHNTFRSNLAHGEELRGLDGPQPKAANMNRLEWDSELAKAAQMWADQCQDGMDEIRVTEEFLNTDGLVGQNIASVSTVSYMHRQYRGLVQLWTQQVVDWPTSNTENYTTDGVPERKATKHFTQVIWAETTKIGCGFVSRFDESNPKLPYKQTLICNYGVGGNLKGSSIYKIGEPGAACPYGHLHGLCKPEVVVEVTEEGGED